MDCILLFLIAIELINGYSNDKNIVMKIWPIIIFGDHTSILKYIDFDFVRGADGTQILDFGEKYNNHYMYYALQTIDILNKNNYERHFKYLKSSSIFVSTYKSEQQKIAKFLSLIDARIDNAKAIKEQLRLKKEYYLQNLFPQDGQTMPNIRFKEFSGGWKRQELQNYVNDIYWIMPPTPNYIKTGVPYITSKNIINGTISYENVKYISDDDYKILAKNYPIQKDDILVGMIGTVGELAIVSEKDIFTGQNMLLISHGEYSPFFLYYLIKSLMPSLLATNLKGAAQKYLTLPTIKKMKILICDANEQKVIESLLKNTDNKIKNIENILIELYKLKQFYLEGMFV